MIEGNMKKQSINLKNESGSAMFFALVIVTLLTMIGISGIKTSSVELQSATNDNLHKLAFYSAEAARPYVMMNPNFYGAENTDPATPHLFPNNSDPYVPITAGAVAPFNLGNAQSFTGSSQYDGDGTPPRGSGYDTSTFRAHQYSMTCIGNGPRNTTLQIDAGFYRIGF